jgi:two-component system, OmpR family, phosphate regulon sensor histidine kinase PhoR
MCPSPPTDRELEHERQLRRNERRLLVAVLDHLPVGAIVADAESGRITRMNAYARALLGMAVQQADVATAGEGHLLDGDSEPFPPGRSPLARALFAGETVLDEPVRIVQPDGSTREVTTTARPVEAPDGVRIGAIALFEDVEDRRRREQAEHDFIVNAAHELRTPLASIISAVEVLESGAKDEPAERDLFIGHVAHEAQRLQRLSRSLLMLARAQARLEPPQLQVLPIRPLLQDVAAATATGADVKVTVRCRRELAVLTNRDLLEQVLANLTTNAARYSESATIAISARSEGDEAVIGVRDRGRGMGAETARRALERFYRAGPRDSQGFGLGLSIAHHAVEAIDGTLEIESVEGVGTTARVRVPAVRKADA